MDRIFNQSYIQKLLGDLRASLNDIGGVLGTMERVAHDARNVQQRVPADVRDMAVEGAASALIGNIASIRTQMEKFNTKLNDCEARTLELIPDADNQYANQIRDLVDTVHNIRNAIAEVGDFLNTTPLTMSNEEFAVAYEALTLKCNGYLENAKQQVEQILANIKGAEQISTAFSKDPVNLSTGNFIYDRTDLEVGGSHHFTFGRFYNAINHRKGALGRDWNHNWEMQILKEGNDLVLLKADGKEERRKDLHRGLYLPVPQHRNPYGDRRGIRV